ncbi:MAG: hypothetical protein IKV47_08055, partial [Oscillospiraceae bacterium]|nr:hypothetical protein [Oscillospiraceae bacterium]
PDRATVICGDLKAKQMRDEVTVVLYKNGEQVSQTYIASIEGVANPIVSGNGKNAALVKAMMRYGDSAAVYFG